MIFLINSLWPISITLKGVKKPEVNKGCKPKLLQVQVFLFLWYHLVKMYILRFRHKVQQPTIQLLQLYKSSPIFIVKIAGKAYSGKKVICEWQTSTLPNWQFELGVMHLWRLQKMTNFSIPLPQCTPHLQKWTIDLLFKNNGIRKHATMYGHLLDNLLILPGLNLCWTDCFSLWILCTYLQAQVCIDLWKKD